MIVNHLPELPFTLNNSETQEAPRTWALLTCFGFATMVTVQQRLALAGFLVATIGLTLLMLSRPLPWVWVRNVIAGSIPLLFSVSWFAGRMTPSASEPSWVHWSGGLVWLLLAMMLLLRGDKLGPVASRGFVAAGLLATLVLGTAIYVTGRGYGIDVTFLHVSAADALIAGESPYSEAVTVFNGSPDAPPGSQIVGYPYPPATLFPFALGTIIDDPRIISLVSWIVTLGIVARAALSARRPLLPLAAFLTLAALPGWPLVLFSSWTEPLTIVLFALALAAWKRPIGSSITLGFGLATKQYLVVLAPLILLWKVTHRRRRIMIALTTVIVATLPVLTWGSFNEPFASLVTFLVDTPSRSDGTSLVGFSTMLGFPLQPPFWMTLLTPLLVAGFLGSRVTCPFEMALFATVSLSVAFFLGSQAFANYWLLPAALMALAVVFTPVTTANRMTSVPGDPGGESNG